MNPGTTIHPFFVFYKKKMRLDKKIICQQVKKVREHTCGKGRTQKKFAEKILKIPYTTYREYETNIVDLEFIQRLHDELGFRLPWLLWGEDPPKDE